MFEEKGKIGAFSLWLNNGVEYFEDLNMDSDSFPLVVATGCILGKRELVMGAGTTKEFVLIEVSKEELNVDLNEDCESDEKVGECTVLAAVNGIFVQTGVIEFEG